MVSTHFLLESNVVLSVTSMHDRFCRWGLAVITTVSGRDKNTYSKEKKLGDSRTSNYTVCKKDHLMVIRIILFLAFLSDIFFQPCTSVSLTVYIPSTKHILFFLLLSFTVSNANAFSPETFLWT